MKPAHIHIHTHPFKPTRNADADANLDPDLDPDLSSGPSQPHPPTSQSQFQSSGSPRAPTSAARGWFLWFEPGTSGAEKRLVGKLDGCILAYTCLSFFVKYLDQTSISNAYISGMRSDLHLGGNELNWLTTYYNIGVIIGGPFVTFALTIVHPRILLPGCTLLMAVFVMCMFRAEDVETLYGLRFCAGLFASGIMPGSYYIIGSWYRKSEIARRAGIFTIASIAGSMFSGYIQAGLTDSMNGRDGLAAWRWLFILDAILSIPVAILGFCVCPDEPASRKMWWMTQDEQAIAVKRLETEGRHASGDLDWSIVKRLLGAWQFYLFPLAYAIKEFTCGTEMTRWMGLYLEDRGYSSVQRNAIPTAIGGAEIVTIFISSYIADTTQRPALTIILLSLVQIYGYAVFVAFPSNNAWLISTYVIAGAGYSGIGPIINAWLSSSCGGDRHLRAVSTGLVTVLGYVTETIAQQVFFPVGDAPAFKPTRGYVWGLCWAVVELFWSGLLIPMVSVSARKIMARRAASHLVSCDGSML